MITLNANLKLNGYLGKIHEGINNRGHVYSNFKFGQGILRQKHHLFDKIRSLKLHTSIAEKSSLPTPTIMILIGNSQAFTIDNLV